MSWTRTTVHEETYRGHSIIIESVYGRGGPERSWLDHSIDGRSARTPKGDAETVAKKLRKIIDGWIADDEIVDRVQPLAMNDQHMMRTDRDALVLAPALAVGDVVWVHAFGARRRGLVVKLTKTRAEVAYVTASNPGQVRRATVPQGEVWVSPK